MGGNTFSSEPQHPDFPIVNHPKFKDSKYIQDNDAIRSTITIEHESDFQLWQQKLNKTSNIDDEVILLPKAFRYEKKAICGSSCVIQIDYDNYSYILADQLQNRRQVKKYFSEPQIWYLLYSLVTAAHDFQKLGERVGDVRPQNIFINEEGHIKVSNLFSWPSETSNYNKTIYEHQKTYLSPEQADQARQGKSQTLIDKYQAESFSIGLTVLQTSLIKKLSYLYLPNKSFDTLNFDKLMKQWWNLTFPVNDIQNSKTTFGKYSDMLKLVIANLCEIKPKDRLTSQQVYNWLKGFHKQINQLLPFTIQNLPPIKNIKKYQNFIDKINIQLVKEQPRIPPGVQYHNQILKKYANPNINQNNFNQQPQLQVQPKNYPTHVANIPTRVEPIKQNYQNLTYVQYPNFNFTTKSANPARIVPTYQNQPPSTFDNSNSNPNQIQVYHINGHKKQPINAPVLTSNTSIGYPVASTANINQKYVSKQPNYYDNNTRFVIKNQNINHPGLTGSQTRSNQFLKQIDDKLNALKKQAF